MCDTYKPIDAKYINPFLTAAATVFRISLGSELTRGQLYLKKRRQPDTEISGVIGISGLAVGTVVLGLSRGVALGAAEAMLGEEKHEIDADVIDVVGEVANMIAGSANAQLEQLAMSISLPNVVIGKNHIVAFPTGATPIGVPFESKWGPVCIEVGLCERQQSAAMGAGMSGGHIQHC